MKPSKTPAGKGKKKSPAKLTKPTVVRSKGAHSPVVELGLVITFMLREADGDCLKAGHDALAKSKWQSPITRELLKLAKRRVNESTPTVAGTSQNAIAKVSETEEATNSGTGRSWRSYFRRAEAAGPRLGLYDRLRELITKVRKSLRPATKTAGDELQLGIDLQDLDVTVENLARAIRKHPPTDRWDAYKSVNRHCRKLKLLSEIERFVERAVRNIPDRPLMQVWRLAQNDPGIAKAADELLKLRLKLMRGALDAKAVDWRKFECLMAGLPSIGSNFRGSPELEVYAQYLELELQDSQWCRRYFAVAMALEEWLSSLSNPDLLKMGLPLLGHRCPEKLITRFAKQRLAKKREKTALRKQRERQRRRLSVRKRDTGQ